MAKCHGVLRSQVFNLSKAEKERSDAATDMGRAVSHGPLAGPESGGFEYAAKKKINFFYLFSLHHTGLSDAACDMQPIMH